MLDDDDPTVVRIPAATGLTLEFEATYLSGRDDPGVLVRVTGQFVNVEQLVRLLSSTEIETFLHSLSDDFRGWDGERVWRSIEDELQIVARHDGHVHLRWDVTNGYFPNTTWTFSTTTHHGAGDDLRRLADAFEGLVARDDL